MQRSLGGRIYYGWIVVGVTALTLITAAGERSVPGVLIHPLEQEFGWSRASISLAVSIGLLLFGLMGPIAGRGIDRIPRTLPHKEGCRLPGSGDQDWNVTVVKMPSMSSLFGRLAAFARKMKSNSLLL